LNRLNQNRSQLGVPLLGAAQKGLSIAYQQHGFGKPLSRVNQAITFANVFYAPPDHGPLRIKRAAG